MSGRLRLAYLADHEHLIPVLAGWLYDTWFREMDLTYRHAEAELSGRLHRDRPPLALVACVGAEPVGTASLIEAAMLPAAAPEYLLAGLYVVPAWRRRGIGTRLCRRVVREARRLHLPMLHLYTPAAEQFYAQRGWEKIADTVVEFGPRLEIAACMSLVLEHGEDVDLVSRAIGMADAAEAAHLLERVSSNLLSEPEVSAKKSRGLVSACRLIKRPTMAFPAPLHAR